MKLSEGQQQLLQELTVGGRSHFACARPLAIDRRVPLVSTLQLSRARVVMDYFNRLVM
jgi:hypothetical protein